MTNGTPPPPPAPPPFGPPAAPARAVPAARRPSALLPVVVVGGLAFFTVVAAVAAAGAIIYMDRGGFARPIEEDPGPVGPGPVGPGPAGDAQPALDEPTAAQEAPAPDAGAEPGPEPRGVDEVERHGEAVEGERPRASASEVEESVDGGTRARRGGTVGNTLGGLPEAPPPPPPRMPIRVGGQIPVPTKVRDVRPVYPVIAHQARVEGTVIIEATIGADGRIEDTRVLRSVPLLDQAALDAVRQWEYTPTRLNGQAVPVVMTVTVRFTLQ